MPDTVALSTGVSLGLLAGIVSGVCYLVASGLHWPKPDSERKRCLPSSEAGVCRRCGGDQQGGFLRCICITQELNVAQRATERAMLGISLRDRIRNEEIRRTKVTDIARRISRPLRFEKGAWFLRQVQKVATLMPWSFNTEKLEQIDEECEGDSLEDQSSRGDLRSVREFLEALSARLAGGPLEGTRVAPLYDHPAYLPARQSHAGRAAPPSASSAHAQLKRLVARVVEEAASLPALASYAAEPPRPPSVDASTYEDLLATAILNKVIERYQTENGSGGRSSGIHSASASPTPSERSSPRSLNSRHPTNVTPPLNEEDDDASDWEEGNTDDTIDLPRRVPFPEFGGDIVHTGESEDQDFDEVSGSDIQATDGSWEENWLFQKKKIKNIHSVPVPMLVPNSNAEYRAMIGDRDVDDTTDLSDNASDEEEEQAEYKSDIKRVLDSKHVIGGKSSTVEEALDFEPDSLTIVGEPLEYEDDDQNTQAVNVDVGTTLVNDTVNEKLVTSIENKDMLIFGIDSGPLPKAEFSLKEEIHRTCLNGSVDVVDCVKEMKDDAIEVVVKEDYQKNREFSQNTLNGHEREGEYEETVAMPVQRYKDSLRRRHFDDEPQTIPTRDTDKDDDLIPGSIAYRERKKWLNYVDMPNNPYSPEAIQKRLSARSTSSLFDMITTSKDEETIKNKESKDVISGPKPHVNEMPAKEEMKKAKSEMTLNVDHNPLNVHTNRVKSPSPRILKDVLAEEVPQYKRYGRDYYIKEARASSGGRKKTAFSDTSSVSSMNKSMSLDNFDTEFASTGLLIKQFNTIATNQVYGTFAGKAQPASITITTDSNNKNNILIEYDDASEQSLFAAKPVYIDDDTDKRFEEILQLASQSINSEPSSLNVDVDDKKDEASEPSPSDRSLDQSFLSSSSLEDSIKIYNVQTGEVMQCKPLDNVSPRYDPKTDRNDNVDMPDKNSQVNLVTAVSHHENDDPFTTVTVQESFEVNKLGIIEEIDEIPLPKVKDLAKKFFSMENLEETVKPQSQQRRRKKSRDNFLESLDKPANKQAYMHSLTARSISREFREELKLSMATPLKTPGGTKEVPDGIEEVTKESSRPGSPMPEPGSLKTKLAFFESLKNRFSTK